MSDQTGSDLACRTRLHARGAGPAPQQPRRSRRAVDRDVRDRRTGRAAPRLPRSTMAPGMCELTLETFRRSAPPPAPRARTSTSSSRTTSCGWASARRRTSPATGFRGSDNPVEGMEQLIGVTGGKLLNIGGGTNTAFDRILRENAAYYVATIEPQRSDRTGRSHQLDVRVGRAGRRGARPRAAITFPAEDSKSRPAAPSPREMLGVMTVFRDLPLRATAVLVVRARGDAGPHHHAGRTGGPGGEARVARGGAVRSRRQAGVELGRAGGRPDAVAGHRRRRGPAGRLSPARRRDRQHRPRRHRRLRRRRRDRADGTAEDQLDHARPVARRRVRAEAAVRERAGGDRLRGDDRARRRARASARRWSCATPPTAPRSVTVPLAIESPSAGRYVAKGARPHRRAAPRRLRRPRHGRASRGIRRRESSGR